MTIRPEYLEQAGELVLEADCLSLAALKLACLLSSLLKFLQISAISADMNFSSFPTLLSAGLDWQFWSSVKESLVATATLEEQQQE